MKSMSGFMQYKLFSNGAFFSPVDKVCEEFLKFRFGDYDQDLRFIDGNQELFKI